MISHANCDHPRTPKARQACRLARKLGAETPAKPRTIELPSDDTSGALRTRQHRTGDAKRRIRHTLEALERAIDQGHPRRVRLFTTPDRHVEGVVVEVGNRVWAGVALLDDDGFEHKFTYSKIFSINFV
jgi:hypothetical protein